MTLSTSIMRPVAPASSPWGRPGCPSHGRRAPPKLPANGPVGLSIMGPESLWWTADFQGQEPTPPDVMISNDCEEGPQPGP